MSSIGTRTRSNDFRIGRVLSLSLLRVTGSFRPSRSVTSSDGFSVASLTPNRLSFSNRIGLGGLGSAYPSPSLFIAIATSEVSSRGWWRHPYYAGGAVAAFSFFFFVARRYLRKRAKERRELIQEIERVEKENWLKKARGEDSESILKNRMKDLGIDPSTRDISTFENKMKVGLEIMLADINAESAEWKHYNNPRFLKRFAMLPYALQKDMLDGITSKRKQFQDHQRELLEALHEHRDKLPEINAQLPIAFQETYKTLDHLIAELSRRMKSKEQESLAAEPDVGDSDILKDDLPTLEKKYSPLKDYPAFWRDAVAKLRLGEFQRSISTMKEVREHYFTIIAQAPLARKQELLDGLKQMKLISPNYRAIFRKYLGDYPDLLSATKKFDEALAAMIVELQEFIDHPEDAVNHSTEVDTFIERSIPNKSVMAVNDVVVAYEHRYDSIQALIRGLLEPKAIQEKITEVLTANPDADLVPLESSLGIKVISVQRKGRQSPSGGIYVGSEE